MAASISRLLAPIDLRFAGTGLLAIAVDRSRTALYIPKAAGKSPTTVNVVFPHL
ncbi:MAG: hypothetical protein HC849_16890 [Oscillatoriales cyanobacterium RU_3_3]|nr:hypothetical protein [Microcoleus sp. SU_5_6]NJL68599.1 hypothetical protein [Microcoleus sp. SM1_3_4]NJM61493.1 hypothetical protein [Oscillatoriales cyanobacterium RU_3_3]NJR26206.1 hypothetical protein [Richelia sp. CSU_2_1]